MTNCSQICFCRLVQIYFPSFNQILYSRLFQIKKEMCRLFQIKKKEMSIGFSKSIHKPTISYNNFTFRGPGRMIVYPRPDLLNESSPAWRIVTTQNQCHVSKIKGNRNCMHKKVEKGKGKKKQKDEGRANLFGFQNLLPSSRFYP